MKGEQLTIKQRLFCRHFLANNFNATQAAISAGYSENSAKEIASETLTKPNVAQFLNKQIRKMEEKLEITAQAKMELLWKCANRCNSEEFHPSGLVSSVAELNKMQGHYAPEKKETTHEIGDKLSELIKQHEKEY